MKLNSYVAIAAMAVAAISTSVAADITIRMTGSTAFRAATYSAITNILSQNNDFRAAYKNASVPKAAPVAPLSGYRNRYRQGDRPVRMGGFRGRR